MTTLRHQVLDLQGHPVAGRLAVVTVYDVQAARPGVYQRQHPVSAVSDAQGWFTWILPTVGGYGDPVYAVTGIEDQQVLVTVPRAVSTATVTATRTGTLPLPAGAAASTDLVTESELANRLAGISGGSDSADAGFDVVLVIGQSNAVGTNTDYDQRTDPPDSRVWAFEGAGTYARQITRAVEPMSHQTGPSGVGPGLPFARWYASTIASNRRVLLVPSGVGGTALTPTTGDTWNPRVRGSMYDTAVSQTLAAMTAAGANARLVAALWVQGEQDFAISASGAAYQEALDGLIGGLRRDLSAPNLPFIIGAMAPPSYRSAAVGLVHAATPGRVRFTAYVAPSSSFARSDSPVHYNAAGQRVMGRLMAGAVVSAVTNTSPAAAPLPGVSISSGTITSPALISYTGVGDYLPSVQTTAQVGDTLVCFAGTNNDTAIVAAPTGGTGLTWTLRAQTPSAPGLACTEYVWTSPVTAALSGAALACNQQGASGVWMDVQVWRGVSGIGAVIHPAVTTNSGATATITTTAANSAIAVGITDWNELDGTTRTWNTTAGALTETFYLRPDPLFTCYAAGIRNTGAAGVKTIGVTSPSPQQASILAVELKG